ncbi:MAG: hypothetical protein K2O58_01675 [Bacteroidales bacterium]|nr:hypothetical protein [Bacteroidales bacterium]
MKNIFFTIFMLVGIVSASFAQSPDICYRVFIPEETGIPVAAANDLQRKLTAAVTNYASIVTDETTSQFYVTAMTFLESKETVPGTPVMYMLGYNVDLYIADAISGRLYANVSFNVKGVGQSEEKAHRNALKKINLSGNDVTDFFSSGHDRIIDYYNNNGKVIISEARTLAEMRDYGQSLYMLSSIPAVCEDIYAEAQKEMLAIYQEYIDYVGEKELMAATALWSSVQSREAALSASVHLVRIDPSSSSYKPALKLLEKIEAAVGKVSEMQMYQDSVDLKKQHIEAARAVGVAFGNGQKPNTTNLLR